MQPYQQDPAGYYPPAPPAANPQPPPPYQDGSYQQPAYGQQPYQQPGYAPPPAHGQPSYQPDPSQPEAYGQGGYQAASGDTPPPYLQASYSDVARNELAKKGQRDIAFGAIWLAVGIGITVVTFAMMDGAGMLVAWGPALYGLYKIIKGLITVARNS